MSQELEKPVLSYTYACASANFNSFELEIIYNTTSFNNDNVFTLELSDKDGNFSSATSVKTITNQNSSFKFSTTFKMPTDAHGEGYKLRVRSSSPEKISPESNSFEAYYVTSERLILNNFTDVILCNGASKELVLNITSASKYQWYKDGVKLSLGGSTLTVTEPGLYYSEIFYGSCYAAVVSNMVEVSMLPEVEVVIKGDPIVEVCLDGSYMLEASINNSDYIYSWFKDGVKIAPLSDYSPTFTIKNSSDLGKYYLEVENINGCIGVSEEVVVKQVASSFSITPVSSIDSFILDGETKTLKIVYDAVNASVKWFRDRVELPNSNKDQIEITVPGIYKAEVTGGSSCATTQESPEFTVNEIIKLTAVVDVASNYVSCKSNTTAIEVKSIRAFDTNNIEYVVIENQYTYLDFQWLKDGILVNNETEKEVSLGNFNQNGVYSLNVIIGGVKSVSNEIAIKLSIPNVLITSSLSSNIICDNTIQLTTTENSNYTYQWFKNGVLVPNSNHFIFETEVSGIYKVNVAAFGCSTTSDDILLNDFDTSIITIDSPLDFILNSGKTKIINASGADSYEWLDNNGNLLSAFSSIEINSPGIYNLLAKVNNCEVLKIVTVSENEEQAVPNALTLNGDGVNDAWVLSNKYAFKLDVEVEIYNANGKQLLKTTNYQNDWPNNQTISKSQLFFYVIKQKGKIIKKGTISVVK
ncbi:hypothetical protein CW731_09525 [Polaribacter sp. ALD11]|uniref:T9SS type B sorting domain-containing protein n=1 Tax=Polaribacter sp. ALD11 TaxID=2058137 RepID=UPI000C30093E|nr:gliding motility-associated C-terminal domain-containing protein [Polaribacter sp. ALD11]AUC85515.1 hypothetical protein CW731_09525 [Polaribacter sp. ALD11]